MTRAPDTTFVLTSCGRFDLLAETLLTFLDRNTAPIARYVIVEDSGDASVRDVLGGLPVAIDFLVNDPPRGQMASIDRAYATVDTPYIFHCEDDWRFLRGGFVEDSRRILDARAEVSMVSCRRTGQLVWHDLAYSHSIPATLDGIAYRTIPPELHPSWGSYTFNPGLRRLADIARVGPFAVLGHEKGASRAFKKLGMTCAMLERPACETTGVGRHVANVREPPSPTRPAIAVSIPASMTHPHGDTD